MLWEKRIVNRDEYNNLLAQIDSKIALPFIKGSPLAPLLYKGKLIIVVDEITIDILKFLEGR